MSASYPTYSTVSCVRSLKYKGWILLSILVFISVLTGVLLRYAKYPAWYGYPIVLLLLAATYLHSYLFEFFAGLAERVSTSRMLYMGRVLSPRYVSYYATAVQVLSYLSVTSIVIGIAYYLIYGELPLLAFVAPLVLSVILATASLVPSLQVAFTTATRKTSTEVELPFLLMLVRVLGSTHLTLYDILKAIEKSKVLKAWSSEVRNAVKLSSILGTSLVTAMGIVAENHPSSTVRDIFKRLLTVAVSVGSVKDIAERAFSQVYAQLEARLSGLTEKLTMVNGVLIFAYLLIPVVVALVAPLYGGGVELMYIISIAVFSLFFFVMYAVVSSIYPSAFEISPPRLLKALGFSIYAALVLVLAGAGFYALSTRSMSTLQVVTGVMPLAVVVPPLVYAELWLRRARTYDKLVRLVIDAVAVSTSLGENFVSVLERMAPRYGRDVEKLVYKIMLAHRAEYLREEVVKNAPSIFHAAFIETMLYSMSMGAKPEMVKELASSYEYLLNTYSKLHSISRTQELMMVGLAAMLGWFIGYVRSMLESYFTTAQKALSQSGAWMPSISILAGFNPLVYDVLNCVVVLALVLLSAIIGKMRGGSIVYGFRTAFIMMLVFSVGLALSKLVAPAPW